MKHEYKTTSQSQTESIGKRLAEGLTNGDSVALFGELGSGKTAFARGILSGLGYTGVVPSPTYSVVNEYQLDRCLAVHFDMYRIDSDEALASAGFYDYGDCSIKIIEWCDRIPWVPDNRFIKVFIKGVGEVPRTITVERN